MKKIVSLLCAIATLAAAALVYSQVEIESSTITVKRERWIENVALVFLDDGKLAIRGDISVRTLAGTNVVRAEALRSITLEGTNLVSALEAAGLPTETQIRNGFRKLFQTAWTNSVSSN